jgi:hypothetical protein
MIGELIGRSSARSTDGVARRRWPLVRAPICRSPTLSLGHGHSRAIPTTERARMRAPVEGRRRCRPSLRRVSRPRARLPGGAGRRPGARWRAREVSASAPSATLGTTRWRRALTARGEPAPERVSRAAFGRQGLFRTLVIRLAAEGLRTSIGAARTRRIRSLLALGDVCALHPPFGRSPSHNTRRGASTRLGTSSPVQGRQLARPSSVSCSAIRITALGVAGRSRVPAAHGGEDDDPVGLGEVEHDPLGPLRAVRARDALGDVQAAGDRRPVVRLDRRQDLLGHR